ncbi:MAG: recombinase RecA [Verrucomicrobiota bacterium]|nr:recombinase RecA [Verrucomicrobiota bacterium]
MAKAAEVKEPDAPTSKKDAARDKNLDMAIQAISKQFGEGSILRLGDAQSKVKIDVIPTGSVAIDWALGVGGVPRGRIIEIYGPESSGKTTLVSHIIANAQKRGGLAAFIDAEHALDPAYAKKIGVDLDQLLVSQPDSGEEALTIAETLIKSNALDVIVIDSVAALVPRAELEGAMGDSVMGLQARLMSQAMRKLTGLLSQARTTCIFTNQLREKIGVMFGSPETTPGGKALKYYASVRIDMRKKDAIKRPDGEIIGNRVKVKIVKNKVAQPFREAEFDILYNEGISREGSMIDFAIERGVIEKKGSWLSFGSEQLAQGRDGTRQLLQQQPELFDKIAKAVQQKLEENVAAPV